MKMNPQKFFYLMCGLNIFFMLAIFASAYYGNVLLKAQSDELLKAKTQNQVIERQQLQLTQAIQDVETYSELNDISKSIVPQDKDQAKTVLGITKIAEETGITISEISFPISNLGAVRPVAPATPPPADSNEAPVTAPPVPRTPPISQLEPAEGIQGVFELQISIVSDESRPVPYDNFISFLERLESNRRTAHVTDIVVNPSDSGDTVTFTLTLKAYVKP